VTRWLHRFEEEGIDALTPRKSPGRPAKVTPEFRKTVDEVARQNPRELGYDFTRWTADFLAEHLALATGIRVEPCTVRETLTDLGFRWGRPKLDLKHRQDRRDVARAKRLRSGALKKR
jgi:transposase